MSITTLNLEVDQLKPTFSRTLVLVVVLCVAFASVQGAEVRLTDGQLIVMGVDDSIGLGAFTVVLSYGSDVSVTSVKELPGFMVAGNIKNNEGMTIIAGISAEGRTGDVPVASVETEGTGPITISVRELGNSRGDPIPATNPEFSGTIPTALPTTSENPPGGAPGESTSPSPTVTATPGKTSQTVEIEPTTVVTAPTTSLAPLESTPPSQATPKTSEAAASTPRAAFPAPIALVAIMAVIALNRKD